MSQSGLAKAYNELPSWAKGVISIVGVGAALFIGYKVYQKIKVGKEAKASKIATNDAENEYKRLLKAGKSLSSVPATYSSLANTIQKLLNGCERVVTEEQVVEEIAKVVKTPIDWFYLVFVFGSRDIDDCGYGKTNYDLTTLLKDQLDTTVVGDKVLGTRYYNTETKDILSGYLRKIGVNF